MPGAGAISWVAQATDDRGAELGIARAPALLQRSSWWTLVGRGRPIRAHLGLLRAAEGNTPSGRIVATLQARRGRF